MQLEGAFHEQSIFAEVILLTWTKSNSLPSEMSAFSVLLAPTNKTNIRKQATLDGTIFSNLDFIWLNTIDCELWN